MSIKLIMINRRIVLGIQYNGESWQGWQTQVHGLTIQDQLEKALQQFTLTHINTICAGRTDSGVHAIEQIVHFDTFIKRDKLSWVHGVNFFLPTSIAVRWAYEFLFTQEEMQNTLQNVFHARLSTITRTYCYILYNGPVRLPLLVGRVGFFFRPLVVSVMQEGGNYLIGKHDFTTFRSAACQANSPIRVIKLLKIQRCGDLIFFILQANAFLYHMIRNIVGALIEVGVGNQSPIWINQILRLKNRSCAAQTFMPDGLYLVSIQYPLCWALPQENIRIFSEILKR